MPASGTAPEPASVPASTPVPASAPPPLVAFAGNVTIPDSEASKMKTLGDAIDYVEKLKGGQK